MKPLEPFSSEDASGFKSLQRDNLSVSECVSIPPE